MNRIIVLCMLTAVMMLNQGCGIATGGATTVKFRINNEIGDQAVRVVRLELTSLSDASEHASICSIPSGSTIDVAITVPASNYYRVYIQDQYGSAFAVWDSVTLTLGNTYSAVIKGDGTSTLDSVKRDSGIIW